MVTKVQTVDSVVRRNVSRDVLPAGYRRSGTFSGGDCQRQPCVNTQPLLVPGDESYRERVEVVRGGSFRLAVDLDAQRR